MKKTILAGIRLQESELEFQEKLDETVGLCQACGLEVVGILTQKSDSVHPHTAFRSGKIVELAALVKDREAQLIVFQNILPIASASAIAEACEVHVIDRTSLILDIFSMRARSRQAKLQTELARLQYDLPRVVKRDESAGHSRGGSAMNRGAGEMRSHLIERRYSKRIQDLKKELEKIQNQKNHDEHRRQKTLLKRVALIGYTNAGKSSLMNAILEKTGAVGKEVYTEDMLFATLDTSVRVVKALQRQFFLYDTVGFVSDLPHTLVEAFQSTLDACKDADLLLHVIDVSVPDWQKKAEITEHTLRDIHADGIPVLRVYNKVDLCESEPEMIRDCISCKTSEGLDHLLERIVSQLYPAEESIVVKIPYEKYAILNQYRAVLLVESISEEEDGLVVRLSGPETYTRIFHGYVIKL